MHRVATRQRCGHPYPNAKLDSFPFDLHLVHLGCADSKSSAHKRPGRRDFSTDTEIDANRGARLVLRQPLLVGESHEETALADGRVSDEEQLAVYDRVCGSHIDGDEQTVVVVHEQIS